MARCRPAFAPRLADPPPELTIARLASCARNGAAGASSTTLQVVRSARLHRLDAGEARRVRRRGLRDRARARCSRIDRPRASSCAPLWNTSRRATRTRRSVPSGDHGPRRSRAPARRAGRLIDRGQALRRCCCRSARSRRRSRHAGRGRPATGPWQVPTSAREPRAARGVSWRAARGGMASASPWIDRSPARYQRSGPAVRPFGQSLGSPQGRSLPRPALGRASVLRYLSADGFAARGRKP